jgi:hypothetical protein
MADINSNVSENAAQVAYTAFEPVSPPSTQSKPNARDPAAARMTWRYWFVRAMFKLVIRIFMCAKFQ